MSACPRHDGHGGGPFPGGACYACWKAAVLSGRPVPPELGTYAGFPPPRPPEPGWRRADEVPDLEELADRLQAGEADPADHAAELERWAVEAGDVL